ncbi:MAG: hypothetical protein LBK60_09865 [Verrucomicrobiales bacterium]|nr:hypothetical protein [Verrucomicrobiales bacterium]
MAVIQIPVPRWSKLSLGTTGVSVLLHLVVLLTLGGVVISRVAPPPAPAAFNEPLDFTAAPPPPPEPELAEPEPDHQPPPAAADAPAPGLNLDPVNLTDHTAAAAAPPPVTVIASAAAAGLAGGAAPGHGAGDRVGAGLRGKVVAGNLFNTPVESARLGVILDISSSAHRYLPLVAREINRAFPDAVIILAYGGGMYAKAGAGTMWLKELGDTKLGEAGAKNTLGQLAKAEAASGDVGEVIKKFRARKDIHILYAENCGHTHFGFEKLIQEKVDTIYWFSDFLDPINPRIADNLAADLKRKHIKVIAHNFSGAEVPAEGRRIALGSGGGTIAQVPGGRKAVP